jgi:hypothetical protein
MLQTVVIIVLGWGGLPSIMKINQFVQKLEGDSMVISQACIFSLRKKSMLIIICIA